QLQYVEILDIDDAIDILVEVNAGIIGCKMAECSPEPSPVNYVVNIVPVGVATLSVRVRRSAKRIASGGWGSTPTSLMPFPLPQVAYCGCERGVRGVMHRP